MSEVRQWQVKDKPRLLFPWYDRGIIHKADDFDIIYYIQGNSVYTAPWATEEDSRSLLEQSYSF